MIKPSKLNKGDTIATISLSWGGAGDLPHRYQIGKEQIEETFGLKVVETRHALRSAEWLDKNPKARAMDLMEAFANPNIKAIFTNIGGDDSIRTLPYMDLEVIRNNPKIFLGFSDSCVTHFVCYKAGLMSYHGPSVLANFAENGGMFPYLIDSIQKTLFSNEIIGEIPQNTTGWTNERLDWFEPSNQNIKRKLNPPIPWKFLQGSGKVQGRLLGGCVEVLEFLKGTTYFPLLKEWQGKILFLETSEVKISPEQLKWILRNYAATGVLKTIKGLLFGRPYDNVYANEYEAVIQKVIVEEEGLTDLPIITQMDFGHSAPTMTLPYNALAEMDMDKETFSILESGIS